MVLGSNPSGGTGRLLPKPTPVETDWDVKTRVLWRPVYLAPVVAGYDCSWRPWLVSETQAASYSAGGGAHANGGVGSWVRRSIPPGCMGSIGAVRSRAWIWDFSSTHSTTALSGGARYRPTTSVTLPTSSGSVEYLKVPDLQGWIP